MSTPKTKAEVYELISKSAIYGNLGFFVGAGFSKSLVNSAGPTKALSWTELLQAVSKSLGIKSDDLFSSNISLPDVATILCNRISEKDGLDAKASTKLLKEKVCEMCSWWPEDNEIKKYDEFFAKITPAWFITTNYDLVIESIFPGRAKSLRPDEVFLAASGMIPVYHLHGVRSHPQSIIITQNDYVQLFRPNEYRQTKLITTLTESTTVCLGYGLGDFNMLTAMDWAKNVFSSVVKNGPSSLIQVYRKTDSDEVTIDQNGVVIIKCSGIEKFFQELIPIYDKLKLEDDKRKESVISIAEQLSAAPKDLVTQFIDDDKFRVNILNKLSSFDENVMIGFVNYFLKVTIEVWARTRPSGAFDAYADGVKVLLDIFEIIPFENIPPFMFYSLCGELDSLAGYIGPNIGQSHDANRVWLKRKGDIPKNTYREIKNYAKSNRKDKLFQLL